MPYFLDNMKSNTSKKYFDKEPNWMELELWSNMHKFYAEQKN